MTVTSCSSVKSWRCTTEFKIFRNDRIILSATPFLWLLWGVFLMNSFALGCILFYVTPVATPCPHNSRCTCLKYSVRAPKSRLRAEKKEIVNLNIHVNYLFCWDRKLSPKIGLDCALHQRPQLNHVNLWYIQTMLHERKLSQFTQLEFVLKECTCITYYYLYICVINYNTMKYKRIFSPAMRR